MTIRVKEAKNGFKLLEFKKPIVEPKEEPKQSNTVRGLLQEVLESDELPQIEDIAILYRTKDSHRWVGTPDDAGLNLMLDQFKAMLVEDTMYGGDDEPESPKMA